MSVETPALRICIVVTTDFVKISQESNKKTSRSHNGFLIFVNWYPNINYSKRHMMVARSTLSFKFCHLRIH